MTEFQRLFESSPNRLTRELLESGLADRAPARGAERALLALGVGLSAQAASAAVSGVTAGVAAPAGTTAAASSAAAGSAAAGALAKAGASGSALLAPAALAKLFALGVAGGIGVAGGAAWVRKAVPQTDQVVLSSRATPAPIVPARLPASRASVARDTTTLHEPLSVPADPNATVSEPAVLRADAQPGSTASNASGTAQNSAASAAQPSPPQNPSQTGSSVAVLPREGGTLAREVALIDGARQALNANAPARALAELERYERERVTGTLDREALLIRIDALALAGRRAEATQLAHGYLTRFPKDAHATRLRALASEP